jgi:predicted amidohydrolase YtcJ
VNKLINCYDSHTHFWATGQVAEGLRLEKLTCADDVKNLKILPQHYRADWITGFGWNENSWSEKKLPDKKVLDQYFPDHPVYFTRVDGHACWLNSLALRELEKSGYNFSQAVQGGIIERDSSGELTGILLDQAHVEALVKLPPFTKAQSRGFFQTSQKIFNSGGFTHIRDMSMNAQAWNILREMEDAKELTAAIESLVTAETVNDLDQVLHTVKLLKEDMSEQLRVNGVKIFIDGSLGSKTAFLSEPYLGKKENGLLIWNAEDIKTVLRKTWKQGYVVAIHCIGDAAVMTAVKAAREVSAEGIVGRLNLEHVELMSPEAIQYMKPLHVTCFLQPCHWLSDRVWLSESLSPKLRSYLFQWELLRKNKIPFFFGSDSPIERPSLSDNLSALNESARAGIPELGADWKLYHQYPDPSWCPSVTETEDGVVKQVTFRGESLF